MHQQLSEAIKYWDHIAPVATYPKNNKAYNELVVLLDELLDIVEDNENHGLIGLVDAISSLIAAYEEQHNENDLSTRGVNALLFLMESQGLSQSDLPEIASQGVLSEILRGKRALNLRQIKLLAKRFNVSPATFID